MFFLLFIVFSKLTTIVQRFSNVPKRRCNHCLGPSIILLHTTANTTTSTRPHHHTKPPAASSRGWWRLEMHQYQHQQPMRKGPNEVSCVVWALCEFFFFFNLYFLIILMFIVTSLQLPPTAVKHTTSMCPTTYTKRCQIHRSWTSTSTMTKQVRWFLIEQHLNGIFSGQFKAVSDSPVQIVSKLKNQVN